MVSEFFICDPTPDPAILDDITEIQRLLIFKKLSTRSDIFSLVLTPSELGGSGNTMNPAGYRYFTGAAIPEIIVVDGKVTIRQGVYFFESLYPFNKFYRDLLCLIIGRPDLPRRNQDQETEDILAVLCQH